MQILTQTELLSTYKQCYCFNYLDTLTIFRRQYIHFCMQVNNNGDVTFDIALRQWSAEAFPTTTKKIIAPFWTDINTSNGGYLWYRTTTVFSILQLGTNTIRNVFSNFATFSSTWMMVVTWVDVAAHGCSNASSITCHQVRYKNAKNNYIYKLYMY